MANRTNRRSRPSRQNTKRSGMRSLASDLVPVAVRTRGSLNPPPVLSDITVTQRFAISGIPNSAGILTLNYPTLMAKVPGGTSTWDRVALQHVEAWGPDYFTGGSGAEAPANNYIQVSLPPSGSSGEFNTDSPNFIDWGTAGAHRAHVSIKPGLFARKQFVASTNVDPVIVINTTLVGSGTSVSPLVIQYTLALRAIAPSAPTQEVTREQRIC